MISSVFLHSLAYMQAFSGQYDRALATADHALVHASQFRLTFVRNHVLATQALALIGIREFSKGDFLLNAVIDRTHDRGARRFVDINVRIIRSRIALAHADYETAAALTNFVGIDSPEKAVYAELAAMHAIALLGQQRRTEAQAAIAFASSISRGVEATCLVIAAEVLLRLDAGDSNPEHLAPRIQEIVNRGGGDVITQCCRGFLGFAKLAVADQRCAHTFSELLSNSHDQEIAETLGIPYRHSITANISSDFTPREEEVVELLIAGFSNQRIAERLVIAESTVKVHLRSIYRKLGVNTRTAAAVKLLIRHR